MASTAYMAYTSFMHWYNQHYAPYGEYDGINACTFCGRYLEIPNEHWVTDEDFTQHWFGVCGTECKELFYGNKSIN